MVLPGYHLDFCFLMVRKEAERQAQPRKAQQAGLPGACSPGLALPCLCPAQPSQHVESPVLPLLCSSQHRVVQKCWAVRHEEDTVLSHPTVPFPQLSPSLPLRVGSQRAVVMLCPGTKMMNTRRQLVTWQWWGSVPAGSAPPLAVPCAVTNIPPDTCRGPQPRCSSLAQPATQRSKKKANSSKRGATQSKDCQRVTNPHWDPRAPCLQPAGALPK